MSQVMEEVLLQSKPWQINGLEAQRTVSTGTESFSWCERRPTERVQVRTAEAREGGPETWMCFRCLSLTLGAGIL